MRQLNNEQARAVRHHTGPMLVLAGPGSGKTFTLVERIRYLIEARGVSPGSILTITFSRKASIEMKTRFYDLIGDKFYPVTFGTFHSIFYNILKTYHNYTTDSILTPKDKITYLKRAYKKLALNEPDSDEVYFDMLSKISRYKSVPPSGSFNTDFNNAVKYCVNQNQNTLEQYYVNYNTFTSLKDNNYNPSENVKYNPEFMCICDEYEKICRDNGKLDFDDMIIMCLKLLKENRAALDKWRSIFRYFLVDEFQDINEAQYEVLMLLAGDEKNIFAVGDDDQSIYGFRGSKPELMKRFLELENCTVVDMYKNYRCAEDVITAAGCLISNNKERIVKNQISCKNDKDGDVYVHVFKAEKEESDFIINKLNEMKDDAGNIESTAILYRTESCVTYLEERLKISGIKYIRTQKTKSFYENEYVKDIISYLKIAISENDIQDIYRIINKPDREISREEVREVEYDLHNSNSKYPSSASNLLNGLHNSTHSDTAGQPPLNILLNEIKFMRDMSCFAAINYILKGLNYYTYLLIDFNKRGKDKASADELIEELFIRARDFNSISSFINYVNIITRTSNHNDAADPNIFKTLPSNSSVAKNTLPATASSTKIYTQGANTFENTNINTPENDTSGCVILQTAHSSKGLEYDTVFITGLLEGAFPHKKACTESETEEERRLMYVAMTRARKTLYVLGRGDEEKGRHASRFIDEVKNCGKTMDIKV